MSDFIPHEAPAKDVSQLPVMHPGRPVGRDEVLQEIYTHLQARNAVLLHGESGAGKTALAAALAAAFTQQPGGVIWISSGTHPLPSLLVRVGRALGLSHVTTSEQPTALMGSVASALIQKKPFMVFDNVMDAFASQQFITKCAGDLPVMLLCESELEGPWASVPLEPMSDMNAVVLFKQKAGINDNDSDLDIYGIAKLLRYQALPIVIAARGMVAAKQAPGDYLSNLQQVQKAVGGDGIRAAIALSYRTLNNALQGLLLMLGATFRGAASIDFLSAVSAVPEEHLSQATTVLSQLYLLEKFERQHKPYYRLHPLIYQFAQNALQGKNQLDGLQQKVHDATLTYAKQHSAAGNVSEAHLAKEIDNFLAAAQWASEHGNRNTAAEFVTALTQANGFVQERGYVYELLRLRELASGSTSAFPAYGPEPVLATEMDDIGDDEAQETSGMRTALPADDADASEYEVDEDALEDIDTLESESDAFEAIDLDDIEFEEGMSSDALRTDAVPGIDIEQLRMALNQAKQQGNITRQVQIYKAIGKVQVGQGKETEAITTYNELLEIYEQEADDEGTLETLNILANLLNKTGNTSAAVMHATRGIQLAEKRADDPLRLRLLSALGDARLELGETDAAVETFSDVLTIARRLEDAYSQAVTLYKLGYGHLDNNDVDNAVQTLEQARALFKEQNKRAYEGRVLGGLGSAYSELQRWSEAIGYYQSALHIAREVGDREEEGLQLSNLGQAQVEAGKLPEALLSYRQALHLAYLSGQREEIVSALVDLVRLMLRSNRYLAICDLLIQDALSLEPDDHDVAELEAQIRQRLQEANAKGLQQAPVNGTAQAYAANAYALLEV